MGAKRSQRRAVRFEKDQSGCMWGLISMFDFRHGGSTRKLIADRRHGSKHTLGTGISKNKFEVLSNLEENCHHTIDGDEIKREIVIADAGKPSVKKLMEEEMVNEQGSKKDTRDAVVEPRQSESAHEGQIKTDHKKIKKNRKKSRDLDAHNLNVDENLKSECSCKQNADQQSVKDLGIDEIMEEFSHRIHQKSISCMDGLNGEAIELSSLKNSDFEEKLKGVIKEFIVQKFTNGKHLKEDQKVQHSKQLMNELEHELELISSDEELFLQVVQDPQSLLVKHVQNLQDSKAEKDEESKLVGGSDFSEQKLVTARKSQDAVNHKQRSFFRRRAKSDERNQLKANELPDNLNRIVILKPGPMGVQNSKTETSLGPSKESHDIVTNKEASDRVGSHFFLSELKRKLKHAMGKQHNEVSRVRVSNRPYHKGQTQGDGEKGVGKGGVGRSSPTKDHFFFERIAKPSSGSKKAGKINKLKDSEISKHEIGDLSNERISNIYVEAKKHLSELLSNGDGMGVSNRQNPKTLGRILSLPDYSISPIGSPGRDWEKSFVTAQMRFTSQDKCQNVNEKRSSPREENKGSPLGSEVKTIESQSPISDISPDHKVQDPNSNINISEDNARDVEVEDVICSTKEGMSCEGDLKHVIEDSINLDSPHETSSGCLEPVKDESMILDLPCEASVPSTARDNQTDGDVPILCEDERNFVCLEQDSHEENQLQASPPGSPSSSLTANKVADLEISIDIPERPSPVSVLEPVFGEDDVSPSKTKSQPVNITVQPLRIEFEEPASQLVDEARSGKRSMDNKVSIFGYVKAVIQASGLNWDDVCIKLLSSDQLLDPSLVDEVEFFSNPLCCDQKLLFDCINEVLVEVCQYHFGCSPWVSFAKPGIHLIPDMKSVILEVSKGVYWHLLQLPLPRTLDQIVRKDMERSGTWLNVQFDAEAIGFDMGEAILEALMEDTILSYVNESSDSEHGVVSESNKSEAIIDS